MKLYAKILPKYFEQIKAGEKRIDFRHIETITFYNTETGEEIELDVRKVALLYDRGLVEEEYPDVKWDPDKKIYAISLGRRL